MSAQGLVCSHCSHLLDWDALRADAFAPCPQCGTPTRGVLFPALLRTRGAPAPGRAATTDESACFYHGDKQAIVPCDYCGRFLCALCDLTVGDRHYCPPCLDAARRKGTEVYFVNRCTRFDNLALALALGPVVLFPVYPVSLCTAPAALFVAIRYWNRKTGVFGSSRIRMTLALLLALAQIAGWAVLLYLALYRLFS